MSENNLPKTQEELNQIIETRLARQKETIEANFADYDELKTKIAALEADNTAYQATIEESKSWEQEKADYEKQISGYKTTQLKQSIAIKAGLPLDLADRLSGDDEESLKADAERFSGFIKPQTPPAPLKDVEPNLGGGKDGAYRKLVDGLKTEGE
ncbi:DUF4355 domain-containing protein [Lactococcus lactis subsp. lactis]|uniref:capsid assembly scaffolding protein Gp46 family protein n=1 Tax=Lactococcus lactis TaxID=1358 RepID=UPI0018E117BB|nr:DUF4355 domain-containing protein [Lactococcus lactis]MCT0060826.1 DUF4355 domain-containing protein [Lactococcus lactis subsp. lactis]MCT0137096.1 DUF4355 domain-containing protein [Lactococcus lactis subsp. lactis]QQC57561.1 DUF4355 domain-containing protein [Lactococcus garvieae]USI70481.1 DUF4355 domain-containing protein [Lactococcus garvieae subsp. garvieae]